MPEHDVPSVASALKRLLDDPALRDRLVRAGVQTAESYTWPQRIHALESFLSDVATPRLAHR
jgi:glycosyltransferase involved in cell wall biosynthesis